LGIEEKRIAKCYIHHDLDERNRCELYDRRLVVVWKGKVNEFAIEDLISVSSNQRKLLIPIIASGILTPLVMVGFFKGLFHPFIALIFIISGVFSFYLGWRGEKALTINQASGHRDFPMPVFTDHLVGFMDYVNQYLHDEPIQKRVLYLEVRHKLNPESDVKEYLKKNPGDRQLYSYWQVKELLHSGALKPDSGFIVLDPISTGTEVKYEKHRVTQELTPVIKGPIHHNAVIRVLQSTEIGSYIE
jgi:hypothetical protein